jgi:hypothetical protein
MQNRSTNPWFNQVYPIGWSVGQANLDPFLRRDLNIGSTTVKLNAYNSLVRPIVEYASTVWDPYTQKDIHTTGTCFIQKIYAPSSNKRKILRRSGEGVKGRCLPWSKEEEGAYIFWMKQVPVHMSLELRHKTKCKIFKICNHHMKH